jgi:hypothetical protein
MKSASHQSFDADPASPAVDRQRNRLAIPSRPAKIQQLGTGSIPAHLHELANGMMEP